jgi:peptidyl-prolyl cis-trans isomerase D
VDSNDTKAVTDAEVRSYFDAHKAEFERPGRARLSVVRIPRIISASDTAAVRARIAALRAEIAGGAKFEDVARRESHDTVSGANGGDLGRGGRGRFVKDFEDAAYRLRPREMSGPVLTQFGYHLIRADDRKGDTLSLRHILLRITQGDSTATQTDRRADELARIAAGSEDPTKLDTAAAQLGLPIQTLEAIEGQPASLGTEMVPSVSAWAFSGSRAGEISELFDDDGGYWIARLDTIMPGGEPRLERVSDEIRQRLARDKALDRLIPAAQQVAQAAVGSTLEAAARTANLVVVKSPTFTRLSFVPGLGQYSRPMGAAFSLPVGAVSAPIKDETGLFVIRVDRRVNASRDEFEKQAEAMRGQRVQQLKRQRLQLFLDDLRRAAKIEDHRKEINATARRLEA